MKTTNIISYVENNYRTFAEQPLCPVDSLILCQLNYVKMEEALVEPVDIESVIAANKTRYLHDFWKLEFFDAMMTDGITDEENRQLFALATASRRFRDVPILYLTAETTAADQKQFAACVYDLGEVDYVAFRGTDGSILGWKEDLNLAFMRKVPSQLEAVEYINRIYGEGGPRQDRSFYIGGHSKGGNLATYAAIMCENSIKDRILEVFCHDSPGFRDEVVAEFRRGHRLEDIKINKTVPQSSIIGMIMSDNVDCRIIKSRALGIFQHSAFTWVVEGRDFVYLEERTSSSNIIDSTLTDVMSKLTPEQLEKFSDALYILLTKNNINSVPELKNLGPLELIKIAGDVNEFDPETRDALNAFLKAMAESAVINYTKHIGMK